MHPTYPTRQLLAAALAANAVRPVRRSAAALPSFAFGWLTTELAPQLLTAVLADTGRQLVRQGRRGPGTTAGLVLSAAATAGLATAIAQSLGVGTQIEGDLTDGLGKDYADRLDDPPSAAELRTSVREVLRPFHLTKPGVEVLRDIGYTRGGKRARLDVYRSSEQPPAKAPVLLQIHGGGWTIGEKHQQGLLLMNRMAERGWVCVAPNYRLAPKHPFPAQIVDVKRALAWVHEHIAEYGGDPSYVVITGGSAGGHLAALAALTPGLADYQPGFEDADTSVSACVPFYGVYDLAGIIGDTYSVGMRDQFLGPRVFLEDPKTHLADFEKASPLTHVDEHAPDFFVLHGANDTLVNIEQARTFVRLLRERSRATVTYAELPGTQHAFEVFGSLRSHTVIRAVQRWLEWHRATTLAERADASAAG